MASTREYEEFPRLIVFISDANQIIITIFIYIFLNLIINERQLDTKWQPLLIGLHGMYFLYYVYHYLRLLTQVKNKWLYLNKAAPYIWLPIIHTVVLVTIYKNTLIYIMPVVIINESYIRYHLKILDKMNWS